MCGYGYTVAGGPLASFFASDLIHRLFHADKIGEGTVFHYADTYQECLDLARESPLDVYAYDIAAPGQGCTGEPVEEEAETAAASSSASATATSSATTASSTATAEAASTTEATTTTDAGESTTQSATESAESVSDVLQFCRV
jgi:hypothetical protein